MSDLLDLWLKLPSVDPVALDRNGVSFRACQMCGGIRQGKRGWLLPCYINPPSIYRAVDDPALIDFCIFDPTQPSQWRSAYGNGVMLGEEAFREARLFDVPLPVFRDPLTWLQSGGAGVLPLDRRAFGIAMLGNIGLQLVGEDLDHSKELKRIVQAAYRLAMPKFRVAA